MKQVACFTAKDSQQQMQRHPAEVWFMAPTHLKESDNHSWQLMSGTSWHSSNMAV